MIKAKASINTCAFNPRDGGNILTWKTLQAKMPNLQVPVVSTAASNWKTSHKTR